MNKKIYFHVGTTKTGSTSIQDFLAENRSLLQRKGYVAYTGKEQDLAERIRTLCRLAGSSKPSAQEKALRWILEFSERLQALPEKNIILSEELVWFMISFSKKQELFKRFIERLQSFADVELLIYLRRQDTFLMSSYQERLKSGKQTGKTCRQKLTNKNFFYLQYRDALSFLIPLVGKEKITIRPFEPSRFFQGSLEADFLHSIGLEWDDEFRTLGKKSNPGMSPFLTEISRCLSFFHYTKEDLSLFHKPNENHEERYFNVTRQHQYLSPRERRQFMEQFEEGNRWVATEMLGHSHGVLFQEPLPPEDEPWVEYKLDPDEVKTFFNNAGFSTRFRRKKMCRQVLSVCGGRKPIQLRMRNRGKVILRKTLRRMGLRGWAKRIR